MFIYCDLLGKNNFHKHTLILGTEDKRKFELEKNLFYLKQNKIHFNNLHIYNVFFYLLHLLKIELLDEFPNTVFVSVSSIYQN